MYCHGEKRSIHQVFGWLEEINAIVPTKVLDAMDG